ncbi:hypothetical protein ACKKBG_A26970 [Auxenochlorella protothecoides x Auxenochlorella symbiontica]
MCDLYPQMLGKLDSMEDDSPKSSVITILAESQSLIVLMSYFVGPASIYADEETLSEVVPLTLLNPSPPPPGAYPPPPLFGSITGNVTRADNVFTFSVILEASSQT